MSAKLTTEQFVIKSQLVHSNQYDYSQSVYINAKTKVTINCFKHGLFSMTPTNHIHGKQGCPICGDINTRKTIQMFINQANVVHNKYDYSKSLYISSNKKVEIICPIHGSFFQTPDQHVNTGTGCPKCTYDNYIGGYSIDYFNDDPSRKLLSGTLYLVEIIYPSETFYKIGITRQHPITKRFNGLNASKINIIHQYEYTIYEAFCQEQQIIKQFKHKQYYPNTRFKGWTECFLFSQNDIDTIDIILNNRD